MKSVFVRCWSVSLLACLALGIPAARAIAGDPDGQDSCANAEEIACGPTTMNLTRNTGNATSDPSDPVPSCQATVGHSVWFKFTAACNGNAAIDTVDSNYDTVLAAYTGGCQASSALWTEIACDDDFDYMTTSSIAFPTTAGTTYWIAVFGFESESGSLSFHFTCTGAPAITCPADITAECDSVFCVGVCIGPANGAVVTYVTPTDACDPNATVMCSPASGSFFFFGMTTVTCTSTNPAGAQTSCTFKVTVTDTTPPMITCPTVPATECTSPGGAPVSYATPIATDTCDPDPTENCVPPSGSTFPIGTTTVTCTATDATGNMGTCTFPVTVQDTRPPMITCPANITAECTSPSGAAVTFTAIATDTCDATPTIVCTPPSGSTFPFGPTSVSCTATDDTGNSSTCVFTVTVRDTTPPSLTCPSTQTRECTSPQGALVNYPSPTSTDLCDMTPTVVCSPPSGSQFPLGNTTVNCSSTDDSQNRSTCQFTVTVRDTVGPVIDCPDPITAVCSGDPEGTVVEFEVEARDVCDPNAPTIDCEPESGSHFPLGPTRVTCTATDGAGNTSHCSFRVTIVGSTSSDLPTAVIGQPSSALVFPLFQSERGRGTVITVTNVDTDRHQCGNGFRQGDVKLVYTYFGFDVQRQFCREFNTEHFLTPGDTLTVLADQDNPEGVLGWLWVEARDPETGAAIEFNHLIGSAIVVDTGLDFMDQYVAYGFRSYVSNTKLSTTDFCGHSLTDLNENGFADFDGVEYDFWPQRLLLDNFFMQGDGTSGFSNELTLASCDIDPFDHSRTIVSAHPWNNRERRFSATFDFECFFHAPLSPAISGVFQHLAGDPNELVFAGHHLQTGWLELDASDPILGVFFQRVVGTGFAAGHQLQFAGQFGGPCDDNPNHEPCALPRVD